MDRDPSKDVSGTEWLPRLKTVGDTAIGAGWKKNVALTITAASKAVECEITVTADTDSGTLTDGTQVEINGITADIKDVLNGNKYFVKNTGANKYKLYTINTGGTLSGPVNTSANTAGTDGTATVQGFVAQSVLYLDNAQNHVTSVNNCPFVIGEKLSLASPNAAALKDVTALGTISDIEMGSGTYAKYVKVTLGSTAAPAATASNFDTTSMLFSTSFQAATFKPGYDVDEVELVMQQIIMPKGYTASMMKSMKDRGMMRYDFVSFMNYKHSMVRTDTEATVQIPLQNSRAKAVLMLPLMSDALSAQQRIEDDDASAFRGILDGIKEYRFNVDQKLNPDRPVPLVP